MIWVWDEMTGGEAHQADGLDDPTGWQDGQLDELNRSSWQVEHVIDLPNGMRIVIERSTRGHSAVLVTQV